MEAPDGGGAGEGPPQGEGGQGDPRILVPEDPPQTGFPQQGPPQQGYPQQGPPPPATYQGPPQQGYPQGGYPPQGPPPQGGTVVVTQPTVVSTTAVHSMRESPTQTTCPYCHAQVVTAVRYEVGTLAWLICVILCLVGCDLGCCFIPFCIDGCKDVIHTCPNCQQQISRWSRM